MFMRELLGLAGTLALGPSGAEGAISSVQRTLGDAWIPVMLGLALLLSTFVVLSYRRGYWFWRPRGAGERRSILHRNADAQAPPQAGAAGAGAEQDQAEKESSSFVRALIALWLVSAMVVFTLASFYLNPTSPLADTLVGGIVASAGAAVAYYFSSKAADQARRDILGAIPGLSATDIPDFRGQRVDRVSEWFRARSDVRVTVVPPDAAPQSLVLTQSNIGRVPSGTTVAVTTGLGQVAGVKVTPGTGILTVNWSALDGASSYLVGISATKEGGYGKKQQQVAATQTKAVISLEPGEYWVRVDAIDEDGRITIGVPKGKTTVA